jgi:hypothetical protein
MDPEVLHWNGVDYVPKAHCDALGHEIRELQAENARLREGIKVLDSQAEGELVRVELRGKNGESGISLEPPEGFASDASVKRCCDCRGCKAKAPCGKTHTCCAGDAEVNHG